MHDETKQRWRGDLAVMAAAVLWGAMGVAVVRLRAAGLDVLSISALRAGLGFLFAFAALMPSLGKTAYWKTLLQLRSRDVLVFAVAGLSGVVGIPLLYFAAIQQAGVGLAALLFYTKPLFVAPLAAVVLGEPVSKRMVAALAVGFAGVALLVPGANPMSAQSPAWAGFAAGIGAGLAGAIFAICNRFSAQRYPPSLVNAANLGCGSVFLWFLEGPRLGLGQVGYGADVWPWAMAMGTVFSFIPFALYVRGLRDVEAGEANVVALLEPITAVLIGYTVFGEHLLAQQWIGIALILAAAVLVTTSPSAERRELARPREGASADCGTGPAALGMCNTASGSPEVRCHGNLLHRTGRG